MALPGPGASGYVRATDRPEGDDPPAATVELMSVSPDLALRVARADDGGDEVARA